MARAGLSKRAAILVAALMAGCQGGSSLRDLRPPQGSASPPPPLPGACASEGSAAAPAGDDAGMPRLAVVLDDPRLAVARALESGADHAGAAAELERVRAGASLDPEAACGWTYVDGRLRYLAEQWAEAAALFDRVAGGAGTCALADHARLRQAQALVRAGRYDDALVAARAIGGDLASGDEAKLAVADALAGKGDRAAALPLWRDVLGASPRGPRWLDLAISVATALLDGVGGPPASGAEEAFDLATRVLVEAPLASEKNGALALRARAAAVAGRKDGATLGLEERAQRAQAWLEGTQTKRAREEASAVLEAVPRGDRLHAGAACKAALVLAQATPRSRAEDAARAWGVAITRCDGDGDALPGALYHGARASASARRYPEAIERYDRLRELFPKHRLADDARLRSAMVVRELRDETRALAMLASLPDEYPEGDMRGEALFRVGLAKLTAGDLADARAAFDRLLVVAPEPAEPGTAGRAAYFRARVAQLAGDLDDAKRRYAELVATQPLGYFMILGYARLRALDDALARSTLQQAVGREPAGPFLSSDHPELSSPAFATFARLLEVGEIEAARRLASSTGLVADGVDPDVLWTTAWLYEQAGAPDISQALVRARLPEYRAHWPAGRWRLPWSVAYPRAWDDLVTRECQSARIPPPLAWAVMREESAFHPDARSPAAAYGLMQLITGTARLVAAGTDLPWDEKSLCRPEVSIALGSRLLSSLRTTFPGYPALAVAAYNGGAGAVRHWLSERGHDDLDVFVESIPFDETRGYVRRVLSNEAAYAYLYAPAALDEVLSVPDQAGLAAR